MPRANRNGVRGLYKDADGRYRIDLRWQHPRTREHLRHREQLPVGLPLVVAKRRASALLAAALDGTFVPGTTDEKPLALAEAFDRYIDVQRTAGLRSLASKVTHGKLFVKVLGASKPIAALVPLDLERVKKHLRDAGREPGTINRHLTTFKHFARWAEDTGTMPIDVCARLCKVKALKEPPGLVRYVLADEAKLFAALTGWLRPIVDAARLTGCRLSELTSLRWSQVDLARNTITLTRTKSGKVRTPPILPELRAVLLAVKGNAGATDYVFHVPKREGDRPTKRTEDERRRDVTSLTFSRWAASVGLDGYTFHSNRHDHATALRRSGAGLDVIAAQLGHSTLQMSARYAHLADDQLREAVALVTIVAPSLPTEGVGQVIQLAANGAEVAGKQGDSERRRADSNRCVKVLQAVPASQPNAAENRGSDTNPRGSES
jgi:integrase